MKTVYKMNYSAGRMGNLEGLFIADDAEMEWLVKTGKDVYFGEVLGKHSEIYGPVEECDIKMVSDEDNVIKVIEEHSLTNGYDPFEYSFLDIHAQELLGEHYKEDLTVRQVYKILNPTF